MNAMLKKTLSCILCFWFAVASTMGAVANAQSIGTDFEAPIIEHEEVTTGTLGDIEVFVATVVDNEELKSVSLFYRYAAEDDFIEIPMQPLMQSSSYTAKIDTAGRTAEDTAIEYYIRAEDGAGNVVLKGLSFNPLVRTLDNPEEEAAPAETIAEAPAEPAPPVEPAAPKKKINWLYVGLGALLVGGLAAAGGGSDSGGSAAPNDPGCTPDCTVTLTLTRP